MTLDEIVESQRLMIEQHNQLLDLTYRTLFALTILAVIGLVAMLLITALAAWSVQRVTLSHQREFKLILELLAKTLPRESKSL